MEWANRKQKELMGDRGNIVVRQESGDVWFYTHWNGSEMGAIVKRALDKKWRWSDGSYLARIVFDELTKGNQCGETGFGISTCIQDNEHPILVVDCPKQTVWKISEGDLVNGKLPEDSREGQSFTDYIVASKEAK